MNLIPILLIDNYFLFPKCESHLSIEGNPYWKKIILQSWKEHHGEVLVIPNKEKLEGVANQFSLNGTLAKINLNIPVEVEPSLVIDSLREVPLRGIARIKLTKIEEKNNLLEGEYQIIEERKLDENTLRTLTEKFFRYLPNILEKVRLSSVDKTCITMMKGNIDNIIDSIVQNSKAIDNLTKRKILASPDVLERLEILISLLDYQKLEEKLEKETREEIQRQQQEYF